MSTLKKLFILAAYVFTNVTSYACERKKDEINTGYLIALNNCVSFSVGQGTGCAWMCNYCANQLGTNNYYFTDSVCTYETGGCVGSPVSGPTYTCCAA